MRTWNQCGKQRFRPLLKVFLDIVPLLEREHRESRKGGSLLTIERRRNPPHASLAIPELGHFPGGEFDKSIRWIGADCMERFWLALREPLEAVNVLDFLYFQL